MTMTAILSTFTEIATWIWSQVTSIINVIVGQPLLLIPIGIFVIGAAVGFVHRLMSR